MTTHVLDQLLQQRRDRLERERQAALQKAQQWLDQHGVDYGIYRALIFGSVTRPGHFHDDSDVDIAVESVDPARYCLAISLLSEWLERDVDLIELNQCHFQHRIRQTGLEWTAPTA
ncbi:MAG: nucleotidyltransferase domain-containing protein [Elainellaceae cyanobacterium]